MQPRIFGPYEAIRRDYPIAEYRSKILPAPASRVRSMCRPTGPKDEFEDEVALGQATVANRHRLAAWNCRLLRIVIVDDVRPQLDQLAKYPLMRGVRMQLHWHENPMYRFAPRPDLMNDEHQFRRNIASLSDYDWSFDLQVFAPAR